MTEDDSSLGGGILETDGGGPRQRCREAIAGNLGQLGECSPWISQRHGPSVEQLRRLGLLSTAARGGRCGRDTRGRRHHFGCLLPGHTAGAKGELILWEQVCSCLFQLGQEASQRPSRGGERAGATQGKLEIRGTKRGTDGKRGLLGGGEAQARGAMPWFTAEEGGATISLAGRTPCLGEEDP